ncbi:30S ribosomal protein S3P [Salinarchaeum sp. Harcht-Bsk1]|uniref:30S ribosomal protein S3 n=1 Tax=Salinarchaeum sp. Harcht-Bsk1 TaxID=1333523 RepID=UPI0003424440|nr:30S ribosomal protein S3 [Salinarchaeum sp. Harcht-Bsk1]AGN02172.1 30S ribosomal protein S3P [Salinarchaeum sp. Harcht-Bsk1]
MADEHQFIEDGLQRSQIDEFFADELGRAGYGGMDVAKTPMGTQIVLKAEKPGMVIGKGGENIRSITTTLEEEFDLEDPQIDVQEVDEPDLNARIVADRLANALERGWYFRKAGHTTLERIMDAGALGAEIVLSGKVTGARGRVEKFSDGYIKHNGEPAEEVVDHGQGVAVMKLGTIGVTVKIIPPGAELPDDFEIAEGASTESLEPEEAEAGVEELLEEPDDEDLEELEDAAADADEATGEADLPEEVVEGEEFEDPEIPDDDDVAEELEELEESVEEDLDEETEAAAEELVEEMEEADEAESDDEDTEADDEAEKADADDADEEGDEE